MNPLNPGKFQPIPPELPRENIELLSCFGTLEKRNEVPFDYYRFYEYQRGVSEKEKLDRQNDILSGGKVKESTEFTNEDFEAEFLELYGPMDKSRKKYKSLFKEYKESRIEEMQGWVKKEKEAKHFVTRKDLNQEAVQQKAGEVIKNNQTEKKVLDAQFTKEEMAQFSSLSIENGPNKGSDWFIQPRPKFNKKTSTSAATSSTSKVTSKATSSAATSSPSTFKVTSSAATSATSNWNLQNGAEICEKNGKIIVKDVNLAVLDPLMEFPEVVNVYEGVELRILVTMRKILSKYPMGICIPEFFLEYEKHMGYMPDLASMGFANIDTFIEHNPDVFWMQEIKDCKGSIRAQILFPSYLRGFSCTIRETLLRVFHQIQVVLFSQGGVIKSTQLFDKMKEFSGQDFIPDIRHWGFENAEAFLEFLLANFSEIGGKIKLLPDTRLYQKAGDRTKFLLRVHEGNEKLIQLTEEFFGPKVFKMSTVGILYSQYVGQGEFFNYEGCNLLPGCILPATLPLEVYNPAKFYLIKDREVWKNIMKLTEDIRDHFIDLDSNKANGERSIAKLEHLRKGSVVAAYRAIAIDREWLRSRVVQINRKENEVTVFGVDTGKLWIITQNEINKKYLRYLPKKFFEMNAQAIGCSLHYGKYNDSLLRPNQMEIVQDGDGTPRPRFKKLYSDCFFEIMKGRIFEAVFLKSSWTTEKDELFWEVSLGIESEFKKDQGQGQGRYVKREVNTSSKQKDFTCVAAHFMYKSLDIFLDCKKAEEEKKTLVLTQNLNQDSNVENVEIKDKVQVQA